MRSRRLRRLSTFSYVGPSRYFLTFCTFGRRSVFTDSRIVEVVRAEIERAAVACSFEQIAYCFMPDHVHLLVEATSTASSLPQFVKAAKQFAGYAARQVTGKPLWQTGYFERVLRAEEHTLNIAAYIINNPVRAGLVSNPIDYPFSGSGQYSLAALVEYAQSGWPRPT
jgi:putative transposase